MESAEYRAAGLSRRLFIERASRGLALGTVGLPLLFEACAPASPSAPAAAKPSVNGTRAAKSSGASLFPTYVPFPNKPKPDFPSAGEPYLDGYVNFPKNPTRALPADAPGAGGTVTSMTIGLFPPPTPFENNPAWQEINKQLNVDFRMVPIGVSDPTVGFVSPTAVRQGVVLDQAFRDGTRDIVVGRRPFSDFDGLVNDWRTGGGETIRKELQDALSSAK